MPPPKDPIKYKEYCKMLSERAKKQFSTPEARQILRERELKRWDDPEKRQKERERAIKQWEDPILRKKQSERMMGKLVGEKNGMFGRSANAGKFGKDSSGWKTGRTIDYFGYVWEYCPTHPYAVNKKYVKEHRLVAEKQLGRYLTPTEVVHHINGIKNDNRPENLYLFENNGKHMSFHYSPYPLISNLINLPTSRNLI